MKSLLISILMFFGLAIWVFVLPSRINPVLAESSGNWWEIRSIDTMKYSRDLAREKLHDQAFERVIKAQVSKIAQTGATHVALGTPYDEEFIPFLAKWVKAVRESNLKVWFRGNFSGWEGWFGYPKISKEKHIEKTKHFILLNSTLFEDGDIFSACTECENGSIGDPRFTGKVSEYREFLIEEYNETQRAFSEIDKKVKSNYISMNGDVANLIMDPETTAALGGVVTIDHYVESPQRLILDIDLLAKKSQGKVVLGEFGVPVPDIHGRLTKEDASEWAREALRLLSKSGDLIGINYWVNVGGSTAIWDGTLEETLMSDVLKEFYTPDELALEFFNEIGRPLEGVSIIYGSKLWKSDSEGKALVPILPGEKLNIQKEGFESQDILMFEDMESLTLILKKENPNFIFTLLTVLFTLFSQ